METSSITAVKLTASEGKLLTRKDVSKEEDRTFGVIVYTTEDDVQNWIEVDYTKKDEHDKYMKEKYPTSDASVSGGESSDNGDI